MSDNSRKKTEERGSDKPSIGNTFTNDGSFLEMFKKRMEEEKNHKANSKSSPASTSTEALENKPKSDQPTVTLDRASDKPAESNSSVASGNKPIIQVVDVSAPFG